MAWDIGFQLPDEGALTPAQRGQVAALFRAIQPSDRARGIPGADDCNAVNFLDRLLAFPPGSAVKIHDDLPQWRANYPIWLVALDQAAQDRFGIALADLPVGQATELLDLLERAQLPSFGDDATQKRAFETIWRHCLQGCWSDPRWGGNEDRIMWRWLGYLTEPEKVALA
jgi:gluconate 2-dehydrogenase gamma chain